MNRDLARPFVCAALLMACCLTGCKLTRFKGPVPESLVQCRELSQQGISALERGDAATADKLLGQAVESCPVDTQARRHYAEALWQRGDKAGALSQLQEAAQLSQEDDTLIARAAQMQFDLGQLEQAWYGANLAIDMNPQSVSAWTLRGDVQRRAGRYREALADYQRALSYTTDQRPQLMAIAETYQVLGESQRSLACLQRLTDTYPPGEEPQQVLYLQGTVLAGLERHEEAAELLATARDRGNPSSQVLVQLAEAQLHCGREMDAKSAVQQALAIDPNDANCRKLAARIGVVEPMFDRPGVQAAPPLRPVP